MALNYVYNFVFSVVAGHIFILPIKPPWGKSSKCAEKSLINSFLELRLSRDPRMAVKNPNRRLWDANLILERLWYRLGLMLHQAYHVEGRRRKTVHL